MTPRRHLALGGLVSSVAGTTITVATDAEVAQFAQPGDPALIGAAIAAAPLGLDLGAARCTLEIPGGPTLRFLAYDYTIPVPSQTQIDVTTYGDAAPVYIAGLKRYDPISLTPSGPVEVLS